MKRQIPNILTCCNLICGCIATFFAFYSVRYAGANSVADPKWLIHLQGCYTLAFYFILLGAVFDFFDGFVARILKVSGPIGVQLDSLADVVTFGVAPGAMIFSLFSNVCYPEAMQHHTWFAILPYSAFLLPAFAAYRLAKFNIDERQHEGFIGLPTPACALFWSALISSSSNYLMSEYFNATFLLAFVLVFCYFMVSDIPMFSLKFKSFSWNSDGNRRRFVFLAIALVALLVAAIFGMMNGHIVQYMSRALVGLIALYIIMSIILMYRDIYKS